MRRTLLLAVVLSGAMIAGCGEEPPQDATVLVRPRRPISDEAKTMARDPRFDAFRALLQKQFAALKKTGDFYRTATGGGAHPMSEADLEQHNALRGESDRLAEECFRYTDEHFPNEPEAVIQQIYDEEQAKAMPEE